MFIPTSLLCKKELSSIDICILGLINNCNCELCYLSQEMIRKKLGYSLKSISLSLNKLVKLGYIDYEVQPGKRYKLIRPTDLFYKFFKKRNDIKKSYRDYRKQEKPKFSKYEKKELTAEELAEAKRLTKELLNK